MSNLHLNRFHWKSLMSKLVKTAKTFSPQNLTFHAEWLKVRVSRSNRGNYMLHGDCDTVRGAFGSVRAATRRVAREMKGFWLTASLLPQTVDGASVTAKSMIHACQAINTSDVLRYHYRLTSAGILIWLSPHAGTAPRRRLSLRAVVVGAVQGSNQRWKAKLAREPAGPCGDFQRRQRLPALPAVRLTIEISHSRRRDSPPPTRSLVFFSFFFYFSRSVSPASYETPATSGMNVNTRFPDPGSRNGASAAPDSPGSSHKRIDVPLSSDEDYAGREKERLTLRDARDRARTMPLRLMHGQLLRYTSFTRGHAIAVCLAARGPVACARPGTEVLSP